MANIVSSKQIADTLASTTALTTYTYSIATKASTFGDYAPGSEASTGYAALNSLQAANFRQALFGWDELIKPDFQEVADNASSSGAIRVAATAGSTHGIAPTTASGAGKSSDVWFNSANSSFYDKGSVEYTQMMQAIGTSLGLKYSFGAGGLSEDYNNARYTIMGAAPKDSTLYTFSKTGNALTTKASTVQASGPMLLDIAAMHSMYGADLDTRLGNTTYMYYQAKSATFQTVYDASGNDTLNFEDFTRTVKVDLHQGAFSSIGYYSVDQQIADAVKALPGFQAEITKALSGGDVYTWTDNLAIAMGTVIENAKGGKGNDDITGNEVANVLYGNDGNDVLRGLEGNDTLYGGNGDDRLLGGTGDDILYGDNGNDTMFGEAGNDKMYGGNGNDLMYGQDGNDIMYGDAGDDEMFGGAGDDVLYGGIGNDKLNGSEGNDILDGGDGNDFLSGGVGTDTLTGGKGADTFFFAGRYTTSFDYVKDFNSAEGDKLAFDATAFNTAAGTQLIDGYNFISGVDAKATSAVPTYLYDTKTHALSVDVDGTGGQAATVIAYLLNAPTVKAADIVFI